MMNWKELPGDARVWIYQSNRMLSESEVEKIRNEAILFLKNWSSHGTPLRGAIEVFHKLFIVVFVDEAHAAATGCSIDKSVVFIKSIENQLGISLFDRMQIAFLENENIKTSKLQDLPVLTKNGTISDSTKFFDNLVNNKIDFENNWLIGAKNTWIERFI